ncbi:MAG: hypothetical protein AAF393_01210 [Pseudomonadota bacterium]
MKRDSIGQAESRLDSILSEKFQAKSGGIERKLNKAASYMPRGSKKAVEADLAYLEAAKKRTAHPRRRGQIDTARVEKMINAHEQRFAKVDVARDRARNRLNWWGVLAINLMIFAGVYYALLKWLGAI